MVQERSNRTVLIVQAAAFTKLVTLSSSFSCPQLLVTFLLCHRYLGNLTVWFDGKGEVVDWDGNPILLDKSIEQGE